MNRKLAKMEQRKKALVAHSKSILDAAEKDSREITAAEQGLLNNNTQELESVSAEINEEVEKCGYSDNPEIGGFDGDDFPGAVFGGGTGVGNAATRSIKPGDLCFRNAENGAMIRGLKSSELFCQHPVVDGEPFAVGRALHGWLTGRMEDFTPKPMASSGQLGGSDIAGGYLFEPTMSSMVVDLARSASVCLRAGAQTIPMGGNELHLVRVAADPTGSWRPEGSAVTASTATFGRITLRAKTLAAIVPITLELLEDAANSASLIEATIGAQLALKLDQAALAGTGAASEPLGIRNTAGVGTVAMGGVPTGYEKTSEAIGQILTANCPDVAGLSWIMHPRDGANYDQLLGLLDGQPLQPTPWVAALQRLYTTSVSITEGGGSDESYGVVGDFSQMLIGMRTTGVVFRRLPAGTVVDNDSVTHNAASELKELLVCHLRADVAIMRPSWFSVLTGLTAS